MKEYIEREAVIALLKCRVPYNGIISETINDTLDITECDVRKIPIADVVSKAAFDQVAWERDVAIQQLREDYGVGLGEKKPADVVERKHGEWVHDSVGFDDFWKCSACKEDWFFEYDPVNESTRVNFCPNCGADMRGEKHEAD